MAATTRARARMDPEPAQQQVDGYARYARYARYDTRTYVRVRYLIDTAGVHNIL